MKDLIKDKGGEPTTDLSAAELVALGYRRVSNQYRLIARIDREDWLEFLAEQNRRAPADFIVRDGTGRPSPQWEDFYRRHYSKDIHTVAREVFVEIPSS